MMAFGNKNVKNINISKIFFFKKKLKNLKMIIKITNKEILERKI